MKKRRRYMLVTGLLYGLLLGGCAQPESIDLTPPGTPDHQSASIEARFPFEKIETLEDGLVVYERSGEPALVDSITVIPGKYLVHFVHCVKLNIWEQHAYSTMVFKAEAGHSYFFYEESCGMFGRCPAGCKEEAWIKDIETGEVVARWHFPYPSMHSPYTWPGLQTGRNRLTREMALGDQWRSLCQRAVEGDGEAASALASHFRHGWQPVENDLVKAYLWYNFASDRGYYNATDYRKDLESEMSSAEISEAKQLVEGWAPDPAQCDSQAARAYN